MKPLLTTALLAILGFAVAGCGATKKIVTLTGTVTLPNVKSGTLVTCKGGPVILVPAHGLGIGQVTILTRKNSPEIQLTHLQNGSVTASCKPVK